MNKIYKVIWSKVKHQYVVTSEFAHSCTKSTTSRVGKGALAALVAFVLTAGVGGVQAAEPITGPVEVTGGVTIKGDDEQPIVTVTDDGGYKLINANGTGLRVGWISSGAAIQGMVLRTNNEAFTADSEGNVKANSLSLKTDADEWLNVGTTLSEQQAILDDLNTAGIVAGDIKSSSRSDSIAIGTGAKILERSANSTVLGDDAAIHKYAENATAIGQGATVGTHAAGSTAIGQNSQVSSNITNAVALGHNSVAYESDTVSVGDSKEGLYRRVTNVADGKNANDAVNVKQLDDKTAGIVKISYDENADMTLVDSNFTVESGNANFTVADGMAAINVDGNTLGMTSEGTTFTNDNSQTVINGGAITTDSIDTKTLTLNGVDFGATLGTIGDNTQHISHYKDEYGVDYTKVEGTVFNADGSMNTANGEFAVYADGTVHSSQNFETKSDVVVLNDDYTPLYSLRNIGDNTQKISYDENADMTLINSGFTVNSGNANFTVADGMAAINVGGNTLGMTSEGTTFTNGGSQTVINGGTITTNKLVVDGVDIGNVAGTATETAKKVQNIEHGVDGNGTSYTKVEGVTMKEDGSISAGANGEFSVGSDGTMNTTGSIISVNENGSTEINGGTITTDNINVDTINGKEIGDFATASDVSGIKQDVSGIKGQINQNTEAIGDVSALKGTNASGDKYKNLTDAVNGNYDRIEQNTAAIAQNSQAINSLGHQVSDLGDEIDSVGAISAALAGLHPLDYDGTGSKFQISAAMGTYDGTQAAAIGGFYHFNRDVMMSLGGATSFEGDKKTAANIGVTFRVGEGASGKSVSDDVMARLEAMDQKIAALEQENKELKNVLGAIDTSLSKEFPDVPANHWAYEAVTKLAGNDVVAGYPDGEFHGDRTMTRYEMAEIIYKAMNRGVQVDQKLVEEFKPEMEQVAANETTQAAPAESTQTGEENA